MKIAQVPILAQSCPPKHYGSIERVVSYLTEELVRQGHDLTLFATGDSITHAKLVPIIRECLDKDPLDHWAAYTAMQLDRVFDLADSFDVIHFHTYWLHFPLAKRCKTPHLTTVHDGLEPIALYEHFSNLPLVSVSNAHRAPLPRANWQASVYNGVPKDLYSFHPSAGDYLAFLGAILPEKGLDSAIKIARLAEVPLYIAGPIWKEAQAYFDEQIKPSLNHPLIKYIGEIGDREKNDFLGKAKALLFPIKWSEPFGMVQIEAFACGTPVIAYKLGAVPEVVDDGVTGFVVTNEEEAAQAVRNIGSIDRRRCRETFERRFTVARMANDYVRVYETLVGRTAAM